MMYKTKNIKNVFKTNETRPKKVIIVIMKVNRKKMIIVKSYSHIRSIGSNQTLHKHNEKGFEL